MPQRHPSFADRLRSALGTDRATTSTRSAPARHAQEFPGAVFADRLRAAVAARH